MGSSPNVLFMCRLCGIETVLQNRVNIFDSTGIDKNIKHKIKFCVGINVGENDFLPKVVCCECIEGLDNFNKFKLRSQQTESQLHRLLEINLIEGSNIQPSKSLLNKSTGKSLIQYTQPQTSLTRNPIQSLLTKPSTLNNKSSIKTDPIPVSLFQCDYCQNVFPTKKETEEHVKQVHKLISDKHFETKNLTPKNAKTQNVSNSVNDFLDICYDKKEKLETFHQCQICSKIIFDKSKFQRHMYVHNLQKIHECSYCGKKFKNNTQLKSHLQLHEHNYSYYCDYCGKGVVKKPHLIYHIRTNHTKDYPYVCNRCGKKFPSKYSLHNHETNVHAENTLMFICETCKRPFKNKALLKNHQQVHIPIEERAIHKCHVCDATFVRKKSLKQHESTHTGIFENTFQCNVCEKAYNTQAGLRIHLLIHSGVKNHICHLCGKSFALKNTLKLHFATHTGEKKYKCDLCYKTFSQKSSLNQHRKKNCPALKNVL